ncbi:cellulose binding domain-containing protein [Actinoplanes sp. CA-030573]|uniref:cellulose binding domain-containing protein n=1 Tax=Actinoplanes sp. CA-030573 TaxID=3239898 RepID=UPI003D8DB055
MASKHSARALGPARVVLSGAVAVLVMLVVWVAVRAVGPAEAQQQPTVVLPSMPQVPVGLGPSASSSSPSPSPSSSPSLSPSASASPSRPRSSSSPSARPTRTRTATRPAAPATTTAAPATFSASLAVGASWEQGYVGMVKVRNTGNVARSWTVTVSHSGLENLRFMGAWGARGTQSGDKIVLTGGPLAPGATASFGYQVSKTGRGNARPAGCTVVGGACSVS